MSAGTHKQESRYKMEECIIQIIYNYYEPWTECKSLRLVCSWPRVSFEYVKQNSGTRCGKLTWHSCIVIHLNIISDSTATGRLEESPLVHILSWTIETPSCFLPPSLVDLSTVSCCPGEPLVNLTEWLRPPHLK